jgi:twitching motility protein PilT
LVFGTLHTNNAAKTVDRIIDVFPTDRQAQVRTMLAESLRGVVAQQLLRRADGKGRIAVYEVLVATPAIRSLIREQKTFHIYSAISTGRKDGMQTLDQHLLELALKRTITVEEALAFAEHPTAMQGKLSATNPLAPAKAA